MAAVSALAGCQVLSTRFGKESTAAGTSGSCEDSLECSFLGSSRSVARLRGVPGGLPCEKTRSAAATSASLFSMAPGSSFMASMIPSSLMSYVQKDDDVKVDMEKDENEVESVSSELWDSINNVLADVVDGQKYLKETGRRKPRPMKRRSLVVCLAMGAIQPYLSEVEDRVVSLRRTASSSFAKTMCLASQLSVGASKAIESIAEEYRKSTSQAVDQSQQLSAPPPETTADMTTIETLRRTTSSSLARAKSLVSQLSIGASRAVNYITEELRKPESGEYRQLAATAA